MIINSTSYVKHIDSNGLGECENMLFSSDVSSIFYLILNTSVLNSMKVNLWTNFSVKNNLAFKNLEVLEKLDTIAGTTLLDWLMIKASYLLSK